MVKIHKTLVRVNRLIRLTIAALHHKEVLTITIMVFAKQTRNFNCTSDVIHF